MYDIKYNYRAHMYHAKCVLACMNKMYFKINCVKYTFILQIKVTYKM